MQLWIHLRLVSLLFLAFAAEVNAGRKSARPLTQKPINWNLSYYSEPFKLCKTLRKYNVVEQARIHGVATEMFRQCGPRLIVPYATKYQLPAFALLKAADFLCFISTVGSAYLGINGLAKDKNDGTAERMIELIRKYCDAMERGSFSIKVKDRHQKYVFEPRMCHGFVCAVVECAAKRVGMRDGDYAKYAVGHFMKLLL